MKMVKSFFQVRLNSIDMQEERERVRRRREISFGFSCCRKRNGEEEQNVGFSMFKWVLVNLWAPFGHKLQVLKTPIYESRMKSTKKRKTIVKKSSFQKVHF